MLHQIIYTSSALPTATLEDIKAIANQASESNRKHGITGILLFTDGVIFQVLEGEKDVVESLFERIKRNPQHSNVMRMISRSASKREFPNWSMGFAKMNVEDVTELAFILTKDTLASALPPKPSTELSVLSNTYALVNRL